jgi:hypothetical protein
VLRPEMTVEDRLELSFLMDDSPARVGCKPVEGVDKDFFGQPIKADGVIFPGPFQNLVFEPALADHKSYATPFRGDYEKLKSASLNRILVWPRRQVELDAPTNMPPTPVGLPTNSPPASPATRTANT